MHRPVLVCKSIPALMRLMSNLTISYVPCLLVINSSVRMHAASKNGTHIRKCTLPFTDRPGPHCFYMAQRRLHAAFLPIHLYLVPLNLNPGESPVCLIMMHE